MKFIICNLRKERTISLERRGYNRANNSSKAVKGKRRGKKKISKVKFILYFFAFQILFGILTAPWIVYYGPFNNLKKNIVGAAMSTFSHQFLATLFLSDEQIQKIRNGGTVGVSNYVNEDLSQIKVSNNDNSIVCKKFKSSTGKFSGLLLEVHNPKKVKIGYTSQLGVTGEKTSTIAKNNGAVAAINGGGFRDGTSSSNMWTGTGAFPIGIIISNGKVVFPKNPDMSTKYYGVAGINRDGVLVVGNYTLNELLHNGVSEAINFGPSLIINGVVQNRDDSGNNIDNQGAQPRTAIGQRKDGTILLLVIDGRQGMQLGASIKDIQQTMVQENAYNAVNLDGGASTTMYYQGQIVNNPCDKFGERTVSTAIYVEH